MENRLSKAVAATFLTIGFALSLGGCAISPAAQQRAREDAALNKAKVYPSSSAYTFALKIQRKDETTSQDSVETIAATSKHYGIGNEVLRFWRLDEKDGAPLYVNIVDIDSIHFDATGKATSYVTLKGDGARIPVASPASFFACDRRQARTCTRWGGGIGLTKVRVRVLHETLVTKETTYKDFNNLAQNVFDWDLFPAQGSKIVDVSVLKFADISKLYDDTIVASEKADCIKKQAEFEKEHAQAKVRQEEILARLHAISQQRFLTASEQVEYQRAMRIDDQHFSSFSECHVE
ncbi:hypothetical protein [Paraburkholderia sp. J10-1]|uniref:hypothetical protein n=1 Tax=Paraburkholderia sp. J10-1 TaxID=2805430 RepID=UPI002AB72B16|nr:hypothetical protein [Paraburkholderia sp. J10-1]